MTDTKDPRGPETPDEIPHFISEEPFDPDVEVVLTEEQENYYMAGQ